MSNPYDFTSGFLTAKSLIETERKNKADEKFRQDVMGPYYQSATKENNEKSGYYGLLKRKGILDLNAKRAQGIEPPFCIAVAVRNLARFEFRLYGAKALALCL